MLASEKQTLANFLDFADKFLGCGYHDAQKEYEFRDDFEPEVSEIQTAGDSLEQIASEIRACKNCRLGETVTNATPGEGAQQPLVMVIGEGPGEEEDKQGRPFVGKAGQLLDKMLAAIDLSRNSNCFIANVVKCRPPGNRDPQPDETAACAHFLERQITLLSPKFILIAGRVAAQTLLKTSTPVGKLRGTFSDITVGDSSYPCLVTYHPSALLRNEDYKRPAWEDLKLLRTRIEELNGES